ncbi:late secretory pathway protein AVL9 homolog [Canis lupus baileyi]|uniref:AVL9 cell migration associated n=2 Tax=Canis lupus familiaris TaxID=9615 RepID=A0A8C0QHJ0_CANLF|nr:late secretory pathway protein AVL9 homolog isoform X1 [Canis lupus dingo]XP_038290109.1 late secretory pathway protein AVL9 homolog isoform X1 [Canis lupus familiaris]XP_038413199.1 late secretory pathway protein AVL9 homolog isoform X1 [Canis lupus familiaris]XP_038413200.1 late secretory pathway protein AVL9 homolog isoform X1 [Canis lupus familiaris]XP_038413201.1 late secretory pathway protein AVL9 homolog isoform X1 [Canis lupus familiaris]XP_038413202.1 late secretory pathway protein
MEKAGRGGDGAPRGPVLHIVVVGFHHKKGCQVEFSYPPLIPGDGHDSHTLPEEWKYLPFLALPDGAHNYQEDTVFFHLPPRNGNGATVYGISCYRQIEAKALKVRQADVTRETVQKSVCVLSKLPLYGLLQAKLQLITHAYFEEKDFSQISILKELYEHMNSSLGGTSLEGSQVYLGLSPRDLVLHFRHKVLILFKLILLEKKVLFYISPVNKLVGALMTVLSLFPGMIEHGLSDCSQYRPRKSMSEDAGLHESNPSANDFLSMSAPDISNTNSGTVKKIITGSHGGDVGIKTEEPLLQIEDDSSKGQEPNDTSQYLKPPSRPSPESSESDWETLDPSVLEDPTLKEREQVGSEQTNSFPKESVPSDSPPITVQPQANTGQAVLIPGLISGLEEDQYGMPLAIFTKGYLCLPYMALQQHHLLSDVTVRGFVAGATNILFRQQKHLSDAIVEVEEALIQIHDPELRKLLNPTTADLRFADYLVRHVTENRDDVFLDGTGWEGGDEWIRAQFAVYIHALLAATLQLDNEKILSDYGTTFVTAWKNTHNYRVWNSNKHPALAEINPNHPFQGQYSVSDMKLRFSHSVQNSERGKKIGNVMVTTSRNVVQTGKAVGQSVGGAFSSAKTAMSSWLSTFTSPGPQSLTEPPDGKP